MGENIKTVRMDLTVINPRKQVWEVIIEANAVFQVFLTSKSYERKYSKAKEGTKRYKGILNVKAPTVVSEIN